MCPGRKMGKLVQRAAAEHVHLYRDHSRIGRAVKLPVQASFSQLKLSKFEGSLARKLRFHIFHFPILRGWSCTKASFSHLPLSDFEGIVSHKSFVFISSTLTFSGTSRTKASFSHLQLSLFDGHLARNAFLRGSGCTNLALQDKMFPGRWMGELACPAGGCGIVVAASRLHLLSSDSVSSLIFFLLLFSSPTLPTSAFPSAHIVGSLTS